MEADRIKWNRKYSSRPSELKPPEPFVVRNANLLQGQTVIDLAAGDGRNTIYLAARSYDVTAVDISEVALERLSNFAKEHKVQIANKLMDLELADELDQLGVFDNILINSFKPSLTLWKKLPSLLHKEGIVILTVFTKLPKQKYGFSSQFCAEEGEYLDASDEFEVLKYEKLSYKEKSLDGYVFSRK